MATFWFRLVRVRVEETDLSVMLGNLYENAIEASLKIEDTSKGYIRIEIACMEGNLIISFSNAAKEDGKRRLGAYGARPRSSFLSMALAPTLFDSRTNKDIFLETLCVRKCRSIYK